MKGPAERWTFAELSGKLNLNDHSITVTLAYVSRRQLNALQVFLSMSLHYRQNSLLYHSNHFVQGGGGETRDKLDEGKFRSISGGTGVNCPNPAIVLRLRIFFFFLIMLENYDHLSWDRGQTTDFIHVHKAGDRGRTKWLKW